MLFLTKVKKKVIAAICACALTFSATSAYTGGTGGIGAVTAAAAENESGSTTYDFRDGSIIPTDTSGNSNVTSEDGKLTVKAGNQNAYVWHDKDHGVIFKAGNTIEIAVDGATKLSIGDCQYSSAGTITVTSTDGSLNETKDIQTGCYHNGFTVDFEYTGNTATTLTVAISNTQTYIPAIITTPIEASTDPKPDVKTTYDFMKGVIVPSDFSGTDTIVYGKMTIKPGSAGACTFNSGHGAYLKNNTTIEIKVSGATKVTVGSCQYTKMTSFTLKSADGKYKEEQTVINACYSNGSNILEFNYTQNAPTTLSFTFDNEAYIPIIITEPIEVTEEPDPTVKPDPIGNGKADVWDFGAEALAGCNNILDVATINGFYADTAAGSSGVNLPSFTAGDLRFEANGKTNHRLRTTNESLTRYDNSSKSVNGTTLSGYIYSNSAASADVYLAVKLYANDILTVYASNNGKDSTIVCESGSNKQSQVVAGGTTQILTFYAPETGEYKLYSADEKLVVARLIREHTNPVKVSGTVNTSEAAGIANYKICFTNTSSGKTTEIAPANGAYTVYLYDSYTYEMSLVDANGYIIKNGTELKIPKGSSDLTKDVEIKSVDLVTVTGSITGLSADELKKLKLSFTNAEKIYVPEITVTGSTFTLKLEKGVTYKITAEGVNDSALSADTISASTNGTQDIAFTKKPVYNVNITLDGIPEAAKSSAAFTFTNINEEGYAYTFAAGETPKLRDGSYAVKVTNIGSAPYVQKLTSNVNVNGAAVSKTISFEQIDTWDFSKYNGNPGIETINTDKYYLGLGLTGSVAENKTYLLANAGSEINIPVKKDQLVTIEYCYSASFEVMGKQVSSNSGDTNAFENVQATASADGFMTINVTGQTYFTKITTATPVDYKAEITVGQNKDYQTINDALAAAAKMSRPNNERVKIVIDPGNYEEMLVVNIPNVSLVNAAGENSSLEITNKGVDIGENVVRITSYYGHGYNYYSMGSDCKWNAEVLAANKANGYISTENPGSGTTNGSYWNSTVVIMGNGFEADGIVFENSFNQYISEKEAADTVVMWASGSKGQRPTTAGDTSVQQKSFVERAAAVSIVGDKSVFNNCKFIGRQDTLYGGQNIKAVFEKCDVLGAVDFIFGGMTAVFYQCNLVMNTNDKTSSDLSYITAPQQASGRGYLMYNCTVTSTTPGVDTASDYRSKPGYFGRPWQANTSEVVFYKTIIETTDYPAAAGKSLIEPAGWNNSLGGESPKMYEYGTTEKSGEDNSASRADWVKENINSATTPITVKAFLGDWTDELNERGLVLALGDNPETPGTSMTPATPVTPVSPATSEPSGIPEEPVGFEDNEIKVTAPDGAFENADEVTFNAESVDDETTDDMFTFDLSFTDKNGNKVQPAVAVTVRIPLPAALAGKTVYVYHVEDDGTYTQIDCTVKDGMVVFTASKFSKYIITSEKLASASDNTSSKPSDSTASSGDGNNSNPSTGIGGMNYAFAAAAALAGGAFIAVKKKKS